MIEVGIGKFGNKVIETFFKVEEYVFGIVTPGGEVDASAQTGWRATTRS